MPATLSHRVRLCSKQRLPDYSPSSDEVRGRSWVIRLSRLVDIARDDGTLNLVLTIMTVHS